MRGEAPHVITEWILEAEDQLGTFPEAMLPGSHRSIFRRTVGAELSGH